MTKSEKLLKAEVKRINTRISAIAKEFGTDSEMYKRIVNMGQDKQTKGLVERFAHKTQKGIIQLNTNLPSLRATEFEHVLNIARKKAPTISQIRKSLGMESKDISKEEVIKAQERVWIMNEKLQNKLQFLYENYTEQEMKEIVPEIYDDGKLDYEEIENILIKIERQRIIDEMEKNIENEDIRNELIQQIETETDLEVLEQIKFDEPFND